MNATATIAAPPGYDLLLAVEDSGEPSGFFVFTTPVIAFEVRQSGEERTVVAIGMDSETSQTDRTAIRAPDGRVTGGLRETVETVEEWLGHLRSTTKRKD